MSAITITNGEHTLTLDKDNTTCVLFKGDGLDHAEVRTQGTVFYLFDPLLLARLCNADYPIYYRTDRPDWAVERAMRAQVNDLDKLLYQVE